MVEGKPSRHPKGLAFRMQNGGFLRGKAARPIPPWGYTAIYIYGEGPPEGARFYMNNGAPWGASGYEW